MKEATGVGNVYADQMVNQCFHIVYDRSCMRVADVVHKLRNFLVALDYEVPLRSPLQGSSLAGMYASRYAELTGKQPKRAILDLLASMNEQSEVLNLSTDLSTTPPTAYYIGNHGCRALLDVVKAMPFLKQLSLRGNGLTNAVMHQLSVALVSHPSITTVDLGDTDISQATAPELCHLASNNEQITELAVDGTSIVSSVWLRRLQTQLDKNKASTASPWSLLHRAGSLSKLEVPGAASQDADFRPNCVDSRAGTPQTRFVSWDVIVECDLRPAVESTDQQSNGEQDAVPASTPSKQLSSRDICVTAACAYTFEKKTVRRNVQLAGDTKEAAANYFKAVDQNTICVRKMHGSTLKLVLEADGSGLEHLQQVIRRKMVEESGGRAKLAAGFNEGWHRVTVRAACEAPRKTKEGSFFVESELWVHAATDVVCAKTVPQLFKEDIARYTGSLRNEVLALMDRIHDEDMVLPEEREALREIEDEEEETMRFTELAELDRAVSYWKASMPIFRQALSDDVKAKLLSRRQLHTNAQGMEAVLMSLENKHAELCLTTPDHPPFSM
eukprot:gene11252-17310_t